MLDSMAAEVVEKARAPDEAFMAVMERMAEWQSRPVGLRRAVPFIDAIEMRIREGQVGEPAHPRRAGHRRRRRARHPGFLWAGSRATGRRQVLAAGLPGDQEPQRQDVLMVVCDGLKGRPGAVSAVWDRAISASMYLFVSWAIHQVRVGEGLGM